MARSSAPRILLKSVRYPTYQLWAAAGNLIRIYFLYDSQRDVIVVGSLPYHLKVAQIMREPPAERRKSPFKFVISAKRPLPQDFFLRKRPSVC